MSAVSADVPTPRDDHDVARLLPRFGAGSPATTPHEQSDHLKLVRSPRGVAKPQGQAPDPLDGVDPDILELMGDSVDGDVFLAEGMPPGFGLERNGKPCRYGALHHRLQVLGLVRSTQGIEPDLDDPERAYAGCEPRHLPLH